MNLWQTKSSADTAGVKTISMLATPLLHEISDSSDAQLMKISRYNIVRELGEGGMGKVYLAEDTQLNRKIVLKVLPRSVAVRKTIMERFQREARAAAALKHPNIVTVYDFNQYTDGHYIAMEYIDGVSLQDLLDKKKVLSQTKVLDIVLQAGRGLRSAHQAGIVHRDIKPGNIMIDREGWVKVLDFGLAKLTDFQRLTKYGTRMGTIPYMSPEQVRGEEVDERSDIFSMGVVLYQLLTQRLPFNGETEAALMYAIAHNSPEPIDRQKSGINADLQRVVGKALYKNPERRYQHLDRFLSDLKQERKRGRPPKTTSSKTRSLSPSDTIRIRAFDTETARPRLRLIAKAATAFLLIFFAWLSLADSGQLAWTRVSSAVVTFVSTKISKSAGQPTSEHLRQLMQITDTELLLRTLELYEEKALIAVDRAKMNAEKLNASYVFITSSESVIDVFRVKNRQFHSLRSDMAVSTLSGKFPGKEMIWVQDLAVAGK